MHLHRSIAYSLGFAALLAACAETRAEHVFILKRHGGTVLIEPMRIPADQTVSIGCNGETKIIDVILPVGPGGSGSLARLSDAHTVLVTHRDGALSVTMRGADGKTWDRPARAIAELKQQDIRVSVTGHDGVRRAFLISGYETVQDEPVGPVIDMFAGRVPMKEGDYVICTDTYEPLRIPRVYGEAPLTYDRYVFVPVRLPDGSQGDFVLDIGAGQTVIAREFLPEDIAIEQSGMVQYSAAGREVLKYEPGGATGKTSAVQGMAVLPELRAGSLVFHGASMAVMPDLSKVFKRPVAGILGLDLLRHAEVISLAYSSDGSVRLVMADKSKHTSGDTIETPMATIQSHLAVRADVNGVSTSFILDTGAPNVFLDEPAARAADIKIDETSGKDVSGLDRGSAKAVPGRIAALTWGGATFNDVPAYVSALPVFATLRVHDQPVGLLGNELFARLNFLELDLAKNKVRFRRR